MVEKSNADYTQRGAAAMLLTNKLQGMSLDDRASRLSSFVPKSVLYDEALSATKVELVKDEETDLVSFITTFLPLVLLNREYS